jgi:ferredoxin
LKKMPLAEKKLVQMGTAALVKDKCIVFTHKTACGACAEHCPTGSVRMVPSVTGIPEPEFDELICIGCGACHHICPALPEKSITVTGKAEQGRALAPRKDLFGLVESASPGNESDGGGAAGNGKDGDKAAGAAEDFPF